MTVSGFKGDDNNSTTYYRGKENQAENIPP